MATEDDKERVWKYATTMEWLDRSLKTVGESTDIPSLDDVSQSDAAHRIPASLKTWYVCSHSQLVRKLTSKLAGLKVKHRNRRICAKSEPHLQL